MDVCLSSRGLGLGIVQMRVVMYIFSTYFPCCVRNVWDRRSLCGHCRVILPTYLPTLLTQRQAFTSAFEPVVSR